MSIYIKNILDFLVTYAAGITILLSMIAAIFKFWQYVDVRRGEQKQKRFENYHKLVERLTAPLPGHNDTWIDVQKAAVFEMKNYPEYKLVTKDIFEQWIKRESRLSDLMRETLKYLKMKLSEK